MNKYIDSQAWDFRVRDKNLLDTVIYRLAPFHTRNINVCKGVYS